jgi:hypothetical protein
MDQVEDWFERLLKVREEHLELHRKLNKINWRKYYLLEKEVIHIT